MHVRDLPRFLRTARYLRAGQVLHRLRRRLSRPIPHVVPASLRQPSIPWSGSIVKPRSLYDDQFVC